MKKQFDILNQINKIEINKIVTRLGNEKLTPSGHGYAEYGPIPIKSAANQSTINYTKKVLKKPAIGLISVVLAANRNFNKVVEPNLNRIEKDYPDLKSFQDLLEIIKSKEEKDFYDFWGHKDKKKYNTLVKLLSTIEIDLRKKYSTSQNDFDLMKNWGNDVDLLNYKNDIIGKIPNIAIATLQHLRMVFGINTVKPDQRVKEVLDYEFKLSGLSDEKVINAIEQIATVVNLEVITVDQIFVKYGSSYYNRIPNKLTIKQVAKKLKEFNVDIEIISKSTSLSARQIEKL